MEFLHKSLFDVLYFSLELSSRSVVHLLGAGSLSLEC